MLCVFSDGWGALIQLYRDCIRLADVLAKKQGFPREALRTQVTAPWRRNQREKDPETYMRQRESAVRGLSNYMFYEASKAGRTSWTCTRHHVSYTVVAFPTICMNGTPEAHFLNFEHTRGQIACRSAVLS
jgi:hypothetical protein